MVDGEGHQEQESDGRAEGPFSTESRPLGAMQLAHADDSVDWDDPDYTAPPPEDWSWPALGQWPAILFTAVAITTSLLWLYAISVPGVVFILGMVTITGFAVIIGVWVLAAAVSAFRIVTRRSRRPNWSLVVVPIVGVATIALTLLDVPVRARFQPARAQFDAYAASVVEGDVDPDTADFGSPLRLGGFEIYMVEELPEGLLLYDAHMAGFDDAGFAYLPEGRFPPETGSFESPDFRTLGGDWYAFTSSW